MDDGCGDVRCVAGWGLKVIALPPEAALVLWNDCVPELARAIEQHPAEWFESLDEMRESVATGERMLIQVLEAGEVLAVALVEFQELRDGKCLHVRYLGGHRMDEWLDEMHARLGEIGRAYGCKWVGMIGRYGWKRALAELGWRTVAITMRAEL